METLILEGEFADVQEQFNHLSCDPKQHVKVIISETMPVESAELTLQNGGSGLSSRITGFRNGRPVISLCKDGLTTERIQELIREEEEEDDLDSYRRARR
jgi:hypothetical protein